MILAIDIGNTHTVIGVIDEVRTIFVERITTSRERTDLEYAVLIRDTLDIHGIRADALEGAIFSSVVPPVTQAMKSAVKKVLGITPLQVSAGMKSGMNIRMDNPATVGSDLIADAVGAISQYPAPLVIFDLGTASTVSVIDRDKNYIGGMIMPGVALSLAALSSRTAQLPAIDLTAPKKLIGTNTIDCMKSGVIYSNAAAIDGIADRVEDELGQKASVVATGGLAKLIIPYCRRKVILDEDLLLKGLRVFYEKNKR
ncbi:MAG: type III pantothenate kinase [Lachnospiraceae bacterium]|jgi:type III pantothenate kinase